jgi:cation diffusion facilitator family transporter
MSDCGCHIEISDREQGRVLWQLLAINALLFVVELAVGWVAQSTGLIADSIDMLADATIYAIGLYAVGKTAQHKARAARLSGWFQAALALMILIDIIRRMIMGSEPVSLLMMGMGVIALIGNVICLRLIARHRDGEVHMRASWIFSKNDVIANSGVILAGALVWWSGSRWPDLIIGLLIVAVVLHGALQIIAEARSELQAGDKMCAGSEKTCDGDPESR